MRMVRIPEPRLEFAHGQAVEDPRDGLTLFGPYDKASGAAYGIKTGVIGTPGGIARFKKWVKYITPARKQVAIRPRNAQTGFQSKNQHV